MKPRFTPPIRPRSDSHRAHTDSERGFPTEAGGRRAAEGNMQGKTVLITGANQGIGKASAIALAKLGAKLVLVCRNREKAQEAIAEIEKAGAKDVELLIGDMGSQADIRRVAREFKAKHDR